MRCMSCDHYNSDGARICISCGLKFDKEVKAEAVEEPVSSYPYPQAMKALQQIIAMKADTTYRIWGAYICIMLLPIILYIDRLHAYFKKIIFWGIVLFIVCAIFTFFINIMRSRHYYSIPTSIDKNKQHRCIFCGHHKIHKQYVLDTSIASHHCESCGKFLFYK